MEEIARQFESVIRYSAGDPDAHSAFQRAILEASRKLWEQHGKRRRDGGLGMSRKYVEQHFPTGQIEEYLPSAVYADYLEENGDPAHRIARLHLDADEQKKRKVKLRGMFVGGANWPTTNGLSWAIGRSPMTEKAYPISLHVGFHHDDLPEWPKYHSFSSPVTLDEAEQIADHHEQFHGPNGFVDELREEIAKRRNPKRRR